WAVLSPCPTKLFPCLTQDSHRGMNGLGLSEPLFDAQLQVLAEQRAVHVLLEGFENGVAVVRRCEVRRNRHGPPAGVRLVLHDRALVRGQVVWPNARPFCPWFPKDHSTAAPLRRHRRPQDSAWGDSAKRSAAPFLLSLRRHPLARMRRLRLQCPAGSL